MLVGVPKEIKAAEYRVGLIPSSVHELTKRGHRVIVELGAGSAIGFSDADYQQAGAEIVATANEIFLQAELIIKVKEPQAEECQQLSAGQTLFTFLHLAPDPKQAQLLQASGAAAIAYETVTDQSGGLPLLLPMSQVAGRLAIQAGAASLEKNRGGRGVLLGGIPGVAPADVLVIGGGVVGSQAILIALGMGARVTVLERSLLRLQQLSTWFGSQLNTIYSQEDNLMHYCEHADLIIGAVLIPGAQAPILLNKAVLKNLRTGAVLVDVAIDQGGCFATSHPTTHQQPTFIIDGIVHYCVANMPGAVPRTSSLALNNATLPFVLSLAEKGLVQALTDDPHLRAGLNVYQGHVTHATVAKALGVPYRAPETLLTGAGS